MTPERMKQIEEIYFLACDRPAAERESFVRVLCGSDDELLRSVQGLIAQGTNSKFLETPLIEIEAGRLHSSQWTAGARVGPFEIVEPLGAGGMGEVYKARDTRLGRAVAIKVLPDHIATREDARARFEREARAVASLNHPNICTLHDVGPNYLVIEYIEGAPLKGPLPLDQALKYAIQVCDAMAAAHAKGVTHRDLKPANILVTKTGVKILDFGLAKFAHPAPTASPSEDPTFTTGLTGRNEILGTLPYMSPEQLQSQEGKEVDARSDIFSFGLILYEMVTGKRAIEGASPVSIIAAIMERPAPSISSHAPPALDWVLQRCLAKNPDERWQSAKDLRAELEHVANSVNEAPTAPVQRNRYPHWRRLAVGVLALLLVVAAAASFNAGYLSLPGRQSAPESRVVRFTVDSAGAGSFFANTDSASSVSPDGRFIVFSQIDRSKQVPALWLRRMDSPNANVLQGTEGGDAPFWSHDSRSIAFFADDKLKRVSFDGAMPVTLCEARNRGPVGGSWNQNGVILFAGADGIHRVSALGGVPVPITHVDAAGHETAHGFPQFLPDGRRFLYFIQSTDPAIQGLYSAALDQRSQQRGTRILAAAHKALYASTRPGQPGYLLWLRDQTLLAQLFDSDQLKFAGEPVRLAGNIEAASMARNIMTPSVAAFWISDSDVLAYRTDDILSYRIVWAGRDGKQLQQASAEDTYARYLRLSPDARKASVRRTNPSDGLYDLWLLDLGSGIINRFTDDGKETGFAVWSPDGRSIAFSSESSGVIQIYRKEVGNGGKPEQLTRGADPSYVTSWSRDGRYLLATRVRGSKYEILAIPAQKNGLAQESFAVAQINAYAGSAAFSPDGKWIAYHSAESGRREIHVQAFPDNSTVGTAARKWQVSSNGGMYPKWRADGKELFYQSLDQSVMAATVRVTPETFEADPPRELFRLGGEAYYDVTADGQRFLLLAPTTTGLPRTSPLTVVLNWQAELKK